MKKIDTPFVDPVNTAEDDITVVVPPKGYLVVKLAFGSHEPLLVFRDDDGVPVFDAESSDVETPMTVTTAQLASGAHYLMVRTFSSSQRLYLTIDSPGGVLDRYGHLSTAYHPLDGRDTPPTQRDIHRWQKYGLLPEDPRQDYEPDESNDGGWVL